MNTVSSDIETENPHSISNGISSQIILTENDSLIHKFHPGLGDHPLWQALMDEMEKNRQADIAEANRLPDLELEE